MGQLGFFDAERRLAALSEKGDPLETIGGLVPWESFRADIEAVVLTPEEAKKSKAGRKPLDALVLFRMLVLQALYNLSDEQIEYQVRDRLSFTRFLGLGFEDGIPDGTTLWLFREKLAQAGLIDKLFDQFDRQLNAKGYIARGGQMVDASIVPAPKPRNTREENEVLKRGETPPAWEEKPAKNRQKDKDARWTKKHGKSFFGYTSTPRESEDPPCQTARSGFYRTDDTARLSGHRIAAKPDRVGSGRVGRSSSGPTCERAGVARRWDELRGDCEGPVAGRRHHPHLVSPV